MANPRFDTEVVLDLSGPEGNSFMILGQTKKAIQREGGSPEAITEYMDAATSGDYEHLLKVTKEWVWLRDASKPEAAGV